MATNDSYRRSGLSSFLGEPNDEDPNVYRAFHKAFDAAPPLLDIRRADGTGEMIPYRFLMRISYTTLPNGNWLISLLCPNCTVLIEGVHLDELVRKLQNCEVAYLQEFNPERWPQSTKETSIISHISINTMQ